MGYLVSVVVFVLAIGFATQENLMLLWNAPSLIIVIVPALAFSIATSSWRTFGRSWVLVFKSKAEATREEIGDVCALLNAFGNLCVLMGIIGFILGLILMLADLSHPSAIGPNMAVASLTVLYGIAFRFLCYAAEKRVNKRLLTSK
ncbi:MAG: hypothetical protein GY866_08585 [Proteobacteria bacterium]|nr:hypothetical protein [Pseudomonadota bacterium]